MGNLGTASDENLCIRDFRCIVCLQLGLINGDFLVGEFM